MPQDGGSAAEAGSYRAHGAPTRGIRESERDGDGCCGFDDATLVRSTLTTSDPRLSHENSALGGLEGVTRFPAIDAEFEHGIVATSPRYFPVLINNQQENS